MVEQKDLSGERLATEVMALAKDGARRRLLGTAARAMARPDAAGIIVDRVLALAG
jgi:UDP-N-acetylglucosamine:LPS N-acetylglucosamine transferase